MAPVKPGRFKFDPGSIAQVRNRLGLSQKKLAALLGIPPNTLSRWETGATTPDADSLAAIYSVAAKHGMSTQFFRKRKKAAKVSKKHPRLPCSGTLSTYHAPTSARVSYPISYPTPMRRCGRSLTDASQPHPLAGSRRSYSSPRCSPRGINRPPRSKRSDGG